MYHTDLKVNGRKITDETQLKPFLECEQFTCEIGDVALQVEFSEERAAYIGWLRDDETEIYYLDNGSGDEEPYPLIDDVCPEERMMCYDTEDIWNIITYFCETGGRNPQYNWTEDDFNWTDYVPKPERKFDKKHLPELYENMHELGYLTYPGEKYVWMSEMEWMPYEEVINYKYEEDVTQEVLPFAFTGGGDLWVFIENGSHEPYIGRYYHPEEDGEYYARNFEDAILRNIIEFAEESAIWLDDNGNLMDESVNIENKLEEIHEQLREYCKVYEYLLCESYLDIIAHLATLPFQKCTFHGNGHWLALLSHEDADALIKQHLDFKEMGKTFIWYTDNQENQEMSQASNSNVPNSKAGLSLPKNHISMKQAGFDNLRFWAYFLSTSYPCAYLEETDCEMYSLVSDVMPMDTAWSDEFTQYYDGVMDENDGYVEEPTTITAPISDSEILKIEFHPGDTIFYINEEEVGCTGPHWKLWAIPYQKVKSLLPLEHGAVLFQLLLPMAVLEEEETADLKTILEKQFKAFGFTQPALSQTADCLISGIVRQD